MINDQLNSLSRKWNNLRIGVRLTAGVAIILALTITVGLVGWYTLESQAHSQTLANQSIDLISVLRAARQEEKNYMLSGDASYIKETLEAIETVRKNAETLKSTLPAQQRKAITLLLTDRDKYQTEFENYVELNRKKDQSLNEMVTQGRRLETTAVTLRDDQKKELQRLEAVAVTASKERQKKSEKADDANRLIKLMGEARQQEKNFLLRHDSSYADKTRTLVNTLIAQAQSTKNRFEDKENKALAEQIILAAGQYLLELDKVISGKKESANTLKTIIKLGRSVENYSVKLREDQKQELITLEQQSNQTTVQRLDKREKADAANRIIKLMGEVRQQEKNFLLRNNTSYAEVTRSLVSQLVKEANNLHQSFQDKQNRGLATQITMSAEQYLKQFNRVVTITNTNIDAQEVMASLGRKVEDHATQLREDQKRELQRLEKISTHASDQRLDKRIKADTANRIIKLMGEARQQEKNFLLRREQVYVEVTRSLVNQAVHQAQLLRDRFLDKQNRELANRIILAAKIYLDEFEDVVISEAEQFQQQERMVNAARTIERLAKQIRSQTQIQADKTRRTAVIVILITSTLALIIGLATAILLTNSIAKPIRQLVDVINRLAREDNVDVPLVSNKDEIGQIARAISNFKEVILQRKEKTEAQLIQAEKMAALGNLVAGVAHEINTPIGIAVTGSTHLQDQIRLLEKTFNDGVLKKSEFRNFVGNAMPTAATIQNNLERASALIKSFKQVAVDQSSQEIRKFKLLDYINEILASLHPKLKQTSHQIKAEGDQHITVETVPGALSQIITNLVMNSLSHAYAPGDPAGNILITIENTDTEIILQYSDDGSGMSAETAKQMYEPFFTTRRGTGGSGLGLSIIFNLVSQTLGGTILCQTDIDKGTQFEIRFPSKPKS